MDTRLEEFEALADVYEAVLAQFFAMSEWLLNNKLFLIGLVIFVIGACIGLVKRVKG